MILKGQWLRGSGRGRSVLPSQRCRYEYPRGHLRHAHVQPENQVRSPVAVVFEALSCCVTDLKNKNNWFNYKITGSAPSPRLERRQPPLMEARRIPSGAELPSPETPPEREWLRNIFRVFGPYRKSLAPCEIRHGIAGTGSIHACRLIKIYILIFYSRY